MYEHEEESEKWNVDELSVENIRPRPLGNSRPLNPRHVFHIAISIETVELIEPIVVDKNDCLIAGAHRLAALRLLNLSTRSDTIQKLKHSLRTHVGEKGIDKAYKELDELREHLPTSPKTDMTRVPVRVFDFDSLQDPTRALEIEISENSQRRDYSPQEVLSLYKTLLLKGYTDHRGRPKKGVQAAKPMVATIIGKSVRTVKRKLEQAEAKEANRGAEELERLEAIKMVKMMSRLTRALRTLSPEVKDLLRGSLEAQHFKDELLGHLVDLS